MQQQDQAGIAALSAQSVTVQSVTVRAERTRIEAITAAPAEPLALEHV